MSETLDTYELKTTNDFKYLAQVVGSKLRNANFKPANREVFLKTLLEEI